VYHGPRAQAVDHFASLGFVPPATGGSEDIADWFVNLVALPQVGWGPWCAWWRSTDPGL